eukprot:1158792-Pelagomonas_calceolata.AAC.11
MHSNASAKLCKRIAPDMALQPCGKAQSSTGALAKQLCPSLRGSEATAEHPLSCSCSKRLSSAASSCTTMLS